MRRPVGLLLAVLTLGALWLAVAANRQASSHPLQPGVEGVRPADAEPMTAAADSREVGTAASRSRPSAPSFAAADGLELTLPHGDVEVVVLAASSRAEALSLTPVDGSATPYRLVRDEPVQPAVSAAELVVPSGAEIAAPVSGRVVEVATYPLSGTNGDVRVVLQPEGRPELAVLLLHLRQPTVQPGDHVVAGVTPIGTVRAMPVDDGFGASRVHVEVKAALEAPPADPHAAALPADATP